LHNIATLSEAQMAELVDASDSKSGIGNNVQVRFLFWALSRFDEVRMAFLFRIVVIRVALFSAFSHSDSRLFPLTVISVHVHFSLFRLCISVDTPAHPLLNKISTYYSDPV
jgi:hypothetical protein